MSLKAEVSEQIKPGDDFYNYVNRKWSEANPIPPDKSRMAAFTQLSDDNIDQMKALLEGDAESGEGQSITLLRQYYRSAMDEAAITTATGDVTSSIKREIEAVKSPEDIVELVAKRQRHGVDVLWNIGIEPDDKDSARYLVRFYQGGLGLPDRDYYTEDSEQFDAIREKYREFLTGLFELLELDAPKERAKRVLALEHKLAETSMTAVERRDPDATYNLFAPGELANVFRAVDWKAYTQTLGFHEAREINVSQPAFLTAALEQMTATPIDGWHDYLLAHSILPLMNKLSKPFEDLSFSFYGKVLSGTEQQEDRYKRVIKHLMMVMPEPLGQLYVQHFFDEDAKAAIHDLVEHLKEAFHARLEALPWMSDATKQKAFEKLKTFLPLLGYPDQWKSYKGVELGDAYADNFLTIAAFEWADRVSRIDKPVDRREWLMSPMMVNAYYWPNTNGITFPAGILQPPFFDASGDFAANYGGIGAVIGHEITHGFDDEGSKFDANGNLRSWWTGDDRKAFDERAKRLVEQYNGYEVHGRHVNGELTLGENIADLGGIHMAYDGLQAKLAELGTRDELDGFTPEQRFFMGYARCWRENIRPELSLQFLVSDPHSPDQFRTNGIVRNCDAFYEAFGVSENDELYLAPDERVRIW
jgi:putative endopeptidase